MIIDSSGSATIHITAVRVLRDAFVRVLLLVLVFQAGVVGAAAAIAAATASHLLWVVVVVVAAVAVNRVYSLAAAGYCRGRGMYQYWISSYHRYRTHYYYPG